MISVRITYFVHGTTTDNERDLATGWLPGELSELGVKQAAELGDLVKDTHFDAVFCSDLKRAVDSAQLGFGNTYQIIADERLRECNYGDLNGKPTEFKDDKMKDFVDSPFPNGESYMDVEKRIADFLRDLKESQQGKHIAIVAHEGPQLALDVLLKRKTWDEAIDENWRNTKAWRPGWEYELPEQFTY
jgi:broad specificity phosphatase PhoE